MNFLSRRQVRVNIYPSQHECVCLRTALVRTTERESKENINFLYRFGLQKVNKPSSKKQRKIRCRLINN